MIIITTIIACYSIAISCLAFYCQKKIKKSNAKKVEFDNINIDLEKTKNLAESLQKQNKTQESLIKSKDYQILELSKTNSSISTALAKAEEFVLELKSKITSLEENNKTINSQIISIGNREARIDAEKKALEKRLEEQQIFIEDTKKNLKTEFENIAAKHLKDNSQEFLENSSSKLADILKPYKEGMEALKTKVESTYYKESKERFSLGEQVKNLLQETNKISSEANNLANALKGQNKILGNWGEMVLETILQHSGLREGFQYSKEKNIKDDEGNNLRPDFIVRLPNNRVVIIDSKTSLVAYEKLCSSENYGMREIYLKEHIASIKNHITDLSDKKYDDLETSLDFTLMFIPIEPAYIAAIQYDLELWNYAYKKRIALISPTNLIVCLKLINELWRREEQSKNQAEILKQVGTLYDKFVGFVESMDKIGRQINGANLAYDEAIKQLNSGKGNLISRVENIRQLGIKTNKTIVSNNKISNKILPDELREEVDEELEIQN